MDDAPHTPGRLPTTGDPTDEAVLRQTALAAIRTGRMPAHQASRIWGGSGSGKTCPVCLKPLQENQFEIEMEFAPNGHQWRVLHLHVHCCSAWEWARRDFPGGKAPHAPIHEAPMLASANGVSLQGPGEDLKIGARERELEGHRGPAR